LGRPEAHLASPDGSSEAEEIERQRAQVGRKREVTAKERAACWSCVYDLVATECEMLVEP